jgi:hypothetical protein
MEGTAMSEKQIDAVLELRTLARKAFITFREQDAGRLREAADEIERSRAALQPDILADSKTTKPAPVLEKSADILPDIKQAVAAERAAISTMIEPLYSDVEPDRRYGVAVFRELAAAIGARGEK